MLAVEEDYSYPARLGSDGDSLEPALDVNRPEDIDDADGSHLALALRQH